MCVRTFFLADGPCSQCVHIGHTIEDVVDMFHGLFNGNELRHFTYHQMFDSLRQIPGYTRCDRALNTGWTPWTKFDNQSSTGPKRSVRLQVDSHLMIVVCSATSTVTSYTNEYGHRSARRIDFDSIARVYRIGSYMPCPCAVMGQNNWYFPCDRDAYCGDSYDWTNHMDRKMYSGRYRDLGIPGVPHPASV
jgi:hypothetical protein